MKRTLLYLNIVYWGAIAIALVMTFLFESEMILSGETAGDKEAEFLFMTLMELVTIAAIPTALRLFKMKKVRDRLVRRKEKALLKWGLVRILILCVPLLADVLLYYLFMQPTFGYLAIIIVLCMVFVFPSKGRCNYEVQTADEE